MGIEKQKRLHSLEHYAAHWLKSQFTFYCIKKLCKLTKFCHWLSYAFALSLHKLKQLQS